MNSTVSIGHLLRNTNIGKAFAEYGTIFCQKPHGL